jgi:hypothetical protein
VTAENDNGVRASLRSRILQQEYGAAGIFADATTAAWPRALPAATARSERSPPTANQPANPVKRHET